MRRAVFQIFRSESPSWSVRRPNALDLELMDSRRTARPVLAHAPVVVWLGQAMAHDAERALRCLLLVQVTARDQAAFAVQKQRAPESEPGPQYVAYPYPG